MQSHVQSTYLIQDMEYSSAYALTKKVIEGYRTEIETPNESPLITLGCKDFNWKIGMLLQQHF